MAYITSVGYSLPTNELSQKDIKDFVKHIFPRNERDVTRLLPVFENASVEKRQFVMPLEWFAKNHSFKERNDIYEEQALIHSLQATDNCLQNKEMFDETIPYEAVDMIIYVSSTGISTPTIDARMINERDFRDDVKRMPLWGLGCAGGSAGLARAMEFVHTYPQKNALVVCVELCSLTFQKNDHRKSNFIGAALFGDGISAALVMGEKSPYVQSIRKPVPKMIESSSKLLKDALDVMGWNMNEEGLQVIFARSIPTLVETFWKSHVEQFVEQMSLSKEDFPFFVAHPGGKKVLEAYQGVLNCDASKFRHSYDVLKEHGNMSSATVLHVLKRWMEEGQVSNVKSLLAALGPGFSSELISLEWS
ncbi:type III polyketide synthase [Pontibacillus yanchengensis]|uniref:Type III polyketide synthase n=2 Tax=Pontibacillus yanchengensis TaxID=462910 RepID=A0ACC7V9A8_9BACI|nr:3-oxoacyl-[acyl-carrier-protein] synthase III C-terminal domain-containing protein [Pontibacillus yanchengensis]MYL32808.1 type III polyketide synthase [Pontibacillus yanchengensis]MYL51718.1 type III polyketide synthase [Pontibacillus yanchengensis]